jgi:hypothetical protein
MVGKTPDMLAELKVLMIQLDKECMGTDRHKTQTTNNRANPTDSNKTVCHMVTQVKAEVACIGMSLSARIKHCIFGRVTASVVAKQAITDLNALMGDHKHTLLQWSQLSILPNPWLPWNSQKTRTSNGACHTCGQENLE